MKKQLADLIREYSILSEEEIQLIVDNAQIKVKPKGTLLLREGQIAEHCYLLLKGCVREYYFKDGQEKSIEFYTEGDSITSFFSASGQVPSSRYLECVEECVLTESTQSLEKEMIELIPRVEPIIRQEAERMVGEMQDKVATLITSTAEERYLNLLKTRSQLLNRIPQHQIASYLGVTPESLSRIRKRIAKK